MGILGGFLVFEIRPHPFQRFWVRFGSGFSGLVPACFYCIKLMLFGVIHRKVVARLEIYVLIYLNVLPDFTLQTKP